MNNEFNFMDSIYGILDSQEISYEDDVMFVDNPDEYEYENNMDWEDDVTIIGEFEEDEFNFEDLGEGYIPLPKGDYEEIPVVVIDEDYMLDEYEVDLIGVEYQEPKYEYSVEEKKEESFDINLEDVKSIVEFQEEKKPQEELTYLDMGDEEERIVSSIAKEYYENHSSETLLSEEDKDACDDTSWVDDPDLFGNDISVIIADNPDSDFIDDDFVDGSFEDWLQQNSTNDSY